MDAYLNCPSQFMWRYLYKIPERSGSQLFVGIAVHAALEYALKRRLVGGGDVSPAELDDVFLAKWNETFQEEESKASFLGWAWDNGDSPDLAREECRALIEYVRLELLPLLKPKLVEQDVKYDYPTAVGPVLMWGKLDLLDEAGVISDWKTTRKAPSPWKLKGWTQFPHYSKFAVELTGITSTKIRKIFLIRGSKPDIKVGRFEISESQRTWYAGQVAKVWEAIQRGEFPTNPESKLCSVKWCSFWQGCQGEAS